MLTASSTCFFIELVLHIHSVLQVPVIEVHRIPDIIRTAIVEWNAVHTAPELVRLPGPANRLFTLMTIALWRDSLLVHVHRYQLHVTLRVSINRQRTRFFLIVWFLSDRISIEPFLVGHCYTRARDRRLSRRLAQRKMEQLETEWRNMERLIDTHDQTVLDVADWKALGHVANNFISVIPFWMDGYDHER